MKETHNTSPCPNPCCWNVDGLLEIRTTEPGWSSCWCPTCGTVVNGQGTSSQFFIPACSSFDRIPIYDKKTFTVRR